MAVKTNPSVDGNGRGAKTSRRNRLPDEAHHANARQMPCPKSQARLNAAKTNRAAHFHKSLPHDVDANPATDGYVDAARFDKLIDALRTLDATGDVADLAAVPGGPRKWVNPLAGWAVDAEMSDPCPHTMPAPPALASEEAAAEIVEVYWMALLRDVPFAQWKGHPDVKAAAAELSGLRLYLKRDGQVNEPPSATDNGYVRYADLPGAGAALDETTVFRGGELFAGDPLRERAGPFVSQFLLQEIPYGTLRIAQRQIHAAPGVDYMTDPAEWLAVQNGAARDPMQNLIGQKNADHRRHLTTMRDLATYVHFDQLYEAYLNAALILVQNGYPVSPGNPYGRVCDPYGIGRAGGAMTNGMAGPKLSKNQDAFGTFGGPHVLSLVCEVATRALKAVWRQKWTHLRLRPEAYAGLLHHGGSGGPLGAGHALADGSAAVARTRQKHGTALLPMAFPEGSPTHPAYGAGHATVAGACVTILKAFFDEATCVSCPVVASADGRALVPYEGGDWSRLTVGLELDKLAANVAIGRDMAGVHWRSDYTQSMLLGQRVAVDVLYRQCRDYAEPEYCFHFTSFGGKKVDVGPSGVTYDGADVLDGDAHGHPDRLPRGGDPAVAQALLAVV